MRKVRFDGKVYKPITFGAGLERGTVEWEERKRQERADARRWREIQAEDELPEQPARRSFLRMVKGLFGR